MARPRTRIPLNVVLNGRIVGRLRRQTSGAIDFQYDATWLAWDHAMPVSLSLPLREDRYIGGPVVAVFDNLLPDNESIRKRLASRVSAEGHDAYSLLAEIGRDCVGALQFLPDGVDVPKPGGISGRALGEDAIAALLNDLTQTPLGLNESGEFRISIAGAQEKTALLYWKRKWHLPHGTTATTHILKPSIGRLPNGIDLSLSVENEHLCLQLLSALGLPCAKTEIQTFKGRRVLVVERFDRRWTKDQRLLRLPQEDFCQALSIPPTRKYETDGGPGLKASLELLKGSEERDADRRSFLKAQIAFWLLGATDGHAKNFSVFLLPGGRFQMTPLYDVMSAQPNLDAGQIQRNKMKLAMAVGHNRHKTIDSILPRHFEQTAAKAGIPATAINEILKELITAAPKAIEKTLSALPPKFPQALTHSITGGINKRLSLCDRALNQAPR